MNLRRREGSFPENILRVWHTFGQELRGRLLRKNESMSTPQDRNEFPESPDYETKSQVARRLSVSRRTIDNLMRQRRLPFIKLTSKIVRFPKAEVDAYLAQQFHINARGQETR